MTSQPVYTAHDVADLFNLLPAALGFAPHESICAIATSGPRHRLGFTMRVDLPDQDDHVQHVARFVAGHLRGQGADGAIVLVVSTRVERAAQAARAVEGALGPIRPVVVAWTDSRRYWTGSDDDPTGTPLDLSPHHPAVLEAVLAGQEVLRDRTALEDRWRPCDGPGSTWLLTQVVQVERELVEQSWRAPTDLAVTGLQEVQDVVRTAERSGIDAVKARSLLRLGVWLTLGAVRDGLWPTLDEAGPERLVTWRELARRSPGVYAAVPYTVAGYLAYLRGDGAQAAIGFERARDADPGYAMAATLGDALRFGTHPRRLREIVRAAFAEAGSLR